MIYWHADRPMAWIDPFQGGLGLGAGGGPVAVRGTPTIGVLASNTTAALPAFNVGDYLCVGIAYLNIGNAPGLPTGWTQKGGTQTSGNLSFAFFVKKAVGGDTFVSTTVVTDGVYFAYAIKNCKVGFDNSASATGTTTSPISTGTVTLAGASDVWITAFCGLASITLTISTPSAGTPTAQQNNATVGMVAASQTLTTTTGPSNTAVVSGNNDWIGFGAGFE